MAFIGHHHTYNPFSPCRRQLLKSGVFGTPVLTKRQVSCKPQLHAKRGIIHLSSDFYSSWKNPNWLSAEKQTSHSRRSIDIALPIFSIAQDSISIKVVCATVALSTLALLGLSYYRFNLFSKDRLSRIVTGSLNRELEMERVVRCNPFTGIRISNVSIPRSEDCPSAPEISASYVDITASGVLRAIVFRQPFQVNIALQDATIRVAQKVVDGPKGVPISEWDPGILPVSPAAEDATDVKPMLTRLSRFIQPGTLTVRNATVFLEPVDFQDYGHGDEIIEIENVSALVSFPTFSVPTESEILEKGTRVSSEEKVVKERREIPIDLDGDFRASVLGTPIDGGNIDVQCVVNGSTLIETLARDVETRATTHKDQQTAILNLRVAGEGVRACRVASFLSLPFRADEGVCSANIEMDFLYKSDSQIPLMRGEAFLESVGLRFHPDPKTPEFKNISGKLRFDGKTMFLDGPSGDLGTLPMAVVGSIHLEDGYSLVGYAQAVDVNNVLETFDVEKFVPVVGKVKGECQLTGSLEEPIISGWVESVGKEAVFDKLPLSNAKLDFAWDAIAGVLDFTSIKASVQGGGKVSGAGSMLFDMTKESPFGISKDVHSPRSPKALYWNPDSDPSASPSLEPPPKDPMEIDEQAPFRRYDSMRFDFQVTDVDGGQLLKNYGGEYGAMAMNSVGLVSGEGVLAGHLKDANCRVLWRSTTPPPQILLKDANENLNTSTSRQGESHRGSPRSHGKHKTDDNSSAAQVSESTNSNENALGGGNFRGLVYIKLGDLPEARRVKARTIVKNFDARRAGWADKSLRIYLSQSPVLDTTVDTYFKGVMFQREILPPGVKKMPRTPQMELLGMDGALAVKKLGVNDVKFNSIMSGSFSFSSSDFSLSLKELPPTRKSRKDDGSPPTDSREDVGTHEPNLNELTVAASRKGEGNICYRRGDSEIVASLKRNAQRKQMATLFTRNVAIQDFVGGNSSFSGGEALTGIVNTDMNLDISSRRGQGRIFVDKPGFGVLKFSSISGSVGWRDRDVFLENGKVKYRRSEYEINARYGSRKTPEVQFGWEVNVNVPRAEINDVSKLIQSGNILARAMQDPLDSAQQVVTAFSTEPFWIEKLAKTHDSDTDLNEKWEVPKDLPLAQQMEWFFLYMEEQESLEKARKKKPLSSPAFPRTVEYSGDITGNFTLKYDSRSGEVRQGPSSGNAVLKAILDQLSRTTFSFQFVGTDWSIGDTPLESISASGSFEDGVLSLGPFSFESEKGFGAEARGRITRAGSVDGSVELRRAPAALVNRYSRAPVAVSGECSGRLEVQGNLTNPRALGRIVWTDATLNGKHVRDAKTDLACVNGRCVLNVGARIGGRRRTRAQSDSETLQSLNWGRGVTNELRDLASKADSRQGISSGGRQGKGNRKEGEEAVQVRVSAPVRFYLLNYIRRRAPSSFWSVVEPALSASYPLDDEWILLDANVKKYGLILLNAIAPELGWDGGDSDVVLQVTGSLSKPVVSGLISVSDGKLSPPSLSESLQSLRGEVLLNENGLISLRSISGRCAGRAVNLNGDLFVSQRHVNDVSNEVSQYERTLEDLKMGDANQRKKKRVVTNKLNDAKTALQRGQKGVTLDFRDIPVNLQKVVLSNLSGKVQVNGVINQPCIGGWLTFSDGTVFLGNAPNVSPIGSTGAKTGRENLSQILEANVESNEEMESEERSSKDVILEKTKDMETAVKRAKSGVESDAGQRSGADGGKDVDGVLLNKLNVMLGRDIKLVQPFVMNMEVGGSITVDGPIQQPEVEGMVQLVRGKVNMLASQLWLRKDERSYVKLMSQKNWESEGNSGSTEPMIKLALEDDRVIVRVSECKLSSWTDNIGVANRGAEEEDAENWDSDARSRLEDIGVGVAMKRFLGNALLKLVEVGGKLGFAEWRLYPTLVNREDDKEIQLGRELGGGAELDMGRIRVSSKRSIGGDVGGRVELRLFKGIYLVVEGGEGKSVRTRLQIGGSPNGDREAEAEAEAEATAEAKTEAEAEAVADTDTGTDAGAGAQEEADEEAEKPQDGKESEVAANGTNGKKDGSSGK